ncbi:MAG TPA: carbonic anhydrase [Pirellulaceae bacterium]|nr:carbonic anhydrase [Pirellulaceae bacterium]
MNRLKYVSVVVVLIVLGGGVAFWNSNNSGQFAATLAVTPTDPDAALSELHGGNLRFVNSSRTLSIDTAHDDEFRHLTAKGQHPFATILCCSDSRVCPEFIFDQRSGSLFEVRNAGNVVDEDVLASLEYAVEHLHVPLIVILGHKGCGAIEAVCEAGGKPLHGHLVELQTNMTGIRKQVVESNHRHDADLVNRLAEENAKQQALTILHDSHAIKAAVDRGVARMVYGIYDMETGSVEFFDLP